MATETVGEALGQHETDLRAQWASAAEVSVLDDDWFVTMHERRTDLIEARRRDWLASHPAKPGLATIVCISIALTGAIAFWTAGDNAGWVIGGVWAALMLQATLTTLTFIPLAILCWSNDKKQRSTLAMIASWTAASLGELDLLPNINEVAHG